MYNLEEELEALYSFGAPQPRHPCSTEAIPEIIKQEKRQHLKLVH